MDLIPPNPMECPATPFDRQPTMPHSSEEPQIHPSVPGPRKPAAPALTPQASRSASTGPRSGPRPAPPRADRSRPGPSKPGQSRPAGSGQPSAAPKAPAANASGAGAPAARIQLVNSTDATAVDTADETVDKLLDDGRDPGEVLLLTTGEQHPWTRHELSFGEESYWQQLAEGSDVFAAHATVADRVQSRPVVVLAVNGGADEVITGALPTALGRATEELIVCGDPQRLRTLL